MSVASCSFRPILRQTTSSLPSLPRRQASSSSNPWPSKTHMRPKPRIPPPLPALYPQKVILSDGSTFTAHTTAPTPSVIRLTRDVTNNPLWAPGTEKRGSGEGLEEGRVGRFRRRFEGLDAAGGTGAGFGEADLGWMSEGKAEDITVPKEGGAKGKKK